jgi:ABC-type lipoprotein export system ATPase subunit
MFQRLCAEEGITVVLVTHDAGVAHYARRIIRIRDGLIEAGAFDADTPPSEVRGQRSEVRGRQVTSDL